MVTLFRNLSAVQIRLLTPLQPVLLLLIRLYWGYQFFLTGRGKLMNLERTTAFFDGLGIPFPGVNAAMAGVTECLGGLLLLFGLGTRIATIPLIVTMLVAYGTAHTEELRMVFSNPDAFVTAPPFLFLLASTIVLVFGPGRLSADGLIKHSVERGCSHHCRTVPGADARISRQPAL